MRILILNWRCPRNPRAGGAEFFTYEVAKRLVAGGNQVEWFSAAFPGAASEEMLDGVRIVRAGRQWTVHLHAFRRYFRRLRGRFDLVIDEVNTVPFFTPLWAEVPVFMLIYQLAREVWWYESPFPINLIGFRLEPFYLRIYRRLPVLTESRSTLDDLQSLGFKGPITVVPVGVESASESLAAKASMPTFIYVGRLAPSKRVQDIVRAFAMFRDADGNGQLWIVGSGPDSYTRSLKALTHRLGLERDVRFFGSLPIADRNRRMAEAHVLLMASVREGWGLVVTEANQLGTPAIVYDVPGLRDAVRRDETGIVVTPSPTHLASGMRRLVDDSALYGRLRLEAIKWSKEFTLNRSAATVLAALNTVTAGREISPAMATETTITPSRAQV